MVWRYNYTSRQLVGNCNCHQIVGNKNERLHIGCNVAKHKKMKYTDAAMIIRIRFLCGICSIV